MISFIWLRLEERNHEHHENDYGRTDVRYVSLFGHDKG